MRTKAAASMNPAPTARKYFSTAGSQRRRPVRISAPRMSARPATHPRTTLHQYALIASRRLMRATTPVKAGFFACGFPRASVVLITRETCRQQMAISVAKLPLGQLLLDAGTITPDILREALARQKTTRAPIGEVLVAMGAVSKDDVLRAVARQQGLPYLTRDELPSSVPVLKNLSAKYLRQYRVCPVAMEGAALTVATSDPVNPLLQDDLRQALGLQIKLAVAPEDAILQTIQRTYGAAAASPLQRIVEGIREEGLAPGEGEEDINQLRDMAFEAPVVRLVNLLIENAVTAEASDIHIDPFEDTLRVRYRIDGILFDQEAPPPPPPPAAAARIKTGAELNTAERPLPQDGRIRVTLGGRRVDIRVSTIPTLYGESIVMRLLDRSSILLPLEKLGFSPH